MDLDNSGLLPISEDIEVCGKLLNIKSDKVKIPNLFKMIPISSDWKNGSSEEYNFKHYLVKLITTVMSF
jgi:hypothetical protein